jgi:3-phenylpropionate/trans-cinnamate dioxygenase ferredoxin reductase subunit
MGRARRAVVVGAGFIGLEFAAVAAAKGLDVTVIEASSRPMSRSLSPLMSEFFREAHGRAGVRFEFDTTVVQIHGMAGCVTEVETGDGRRFPADLVIIAIGVVPNLEIAAAADLPVRNGVVVDERLLTADPSISAIGDCAAYPGSYAKGATIRLECVQNAVEQGRCVAIRLTGRPVNYTGLPWFWSDEGVLRLQIAGLATPHETPILRGDPATGSFSVFCFTGGKLVGVESGWKAQRRENAR